MDWIQNALVPRHVVSACALLPNSAIATRPGLVLPVQVAHSRLLHTVSKIVAGTMGQCGRLDGRTRSLGATFWHLVPMTTRSSSGRRQTKITGPNTTNITNIMVQVCSGPYTESSSPLGRCVCEGGGLKKYAVHICRQPRLPPPFFLVWTRGTQELLGTKVCCGAEVGTILQRKMRKFATFAL